MSRARTSAKAAGSSFETLIAGYLAEKVDDRIERRAKNGAKDRGDLASVRTRHNERLVVECKEYGGRILAPEWTKEAEVERQNDEALAGVVVAKRRGTRNPGQQWVLMTVDDLVGLLTGVRP